MSPPIIAIGCDCSKGRIDVEIRNHHGTVLHTGAFDETPQEHRRFAEEFVSLRERFPDARILVGIESTGGLERNWLKFFRLETKLHKDMRIFHLNAQTVHAYRKVKLHRSPGDAAAATDIARYLLDHCATKTPDSEVENGPVVCYRLIRSMIEDSVAFRIRLKGLLVSVHPDLVRFCRVGLPQWIVLLLAKYPTARLLAKAHVATVDAIAHISTERATELIANAKESVASLTDDATEVTIKYLVRHIQQIDENIANARADLQMTIEKSPESELCKNIKLLDTIPGIGIWSAIRIACEIGNIHRFGDEKALIAWSGLDPVVEISGDGIHQRGISHRGNAHIRAILFPVAMTAVQYNPIMQQLFDRIRERGKTKLHAYVAVMAKILRLINGILRSGKPFEKDYETKRKTEIAQQQKARSEQPKPPQPTTNYPPQLNAPITHREVQRRKKAAASNSQARDQSPKNEIERGAPPSISTQTNISKG